MRNVKVGCCMWLCVGGVFGVCVSMRRVRVGCAVFVDVSRNFVVCRCMQVEVLGCVSVNKETRPPPWPVFVCLSRIALYLSKNTRKMRDRVTS